VDIIARTPQDPQKRTNEILDAAEALFYAIGYHQTMVSDIVKRIGVAQGTFYYYFTSKEEIVEALINRQLSKFNLEIEAMVCSNEITPSRKIELMVYILFHTIHYKQGLLLEFLYNDQYLHLVDKLFRQAKKLLAPFLLRIIEEGNHKKYFNVFHPAASMNYILTIIQCFVEAIYEKSPVEILSAHLELAKNLIEKALGVSEGTLQIHWEQLTSK
jgi:AcrR family transcriptional regulator